MTVQIWKHRKQLLAISLTAGLLALPAVTVAVSGDGQGNAGCGSLGAAPKAGKLDSTVYVFNVTPVDGTPQDESWVIDYGQGKGEEALSGKHAEHDFGQSGTFTVKVRAEQDTGGAKVCAVTLTTGGVQDTPMPTPTATPTPTPAPATPTPTPAVQAADTSGAPLTNTGPEDTFLAAGGLGGMALAARAYLRSRRSLVKAIRHQD
ncbi:MAG TPA: hypothetical protein VLF67_00905 [Candidatus Saccharimonas sp.]|nr:hypothetical protein [Candidatus Saccharimonas sp.]